MKCEQKMKVFAQVLPMYLFIVIITMTDEKIPPQ